MFRGPLIRKLGLSSPVDTQIFALMLSLSAHNDFVNPVSGRDSLAIRSSWCLVTTRGVLDQVVFGMRGPMRAARLDTPWWELATFMVAIVDMAMDTV